jgi:uncharacterized protein
MQLAIRVRGCPSQHLISFIFFGYLWPHFLPASSMPSLGAARSCRSPHSSPAPRPSVWVQWRLWPGQLTSLLAFRKLLRQYRWKLVPLAVASGVGGWLGGMLLLKTGNKMFREMLPWLLLFAAVMFVLSFPLGRWLQTLSGGKRYNTWLLIGMVVVSIYVGYFGAGGGFLVMALFGICGVHDIHEMNALKVVTAVVSIGIPSINFILAGRVQWRFCLEMAILAALGGYFGAHYSRKINQRAMRWTVAIIGFITAGYFFLANYLNHPR